MISSSCGWSQLLLHLHWHSPSEMTQICWRCLSGTAICWNGKQSWNSDSAGEGAFLQLFTDALCFTAETLQKKNKKSKENLHMLRHPGAGENLAIVFWSVSSPLSVCLTNCWRDHWKYVPEHHSSLSKNSLYNSSWHSITGLFVPIFLCTHLVNTKHFIAKLSCPGGVRYIPPRVAEKAATKDVQ